METIININNENLANYIMFKLDKIDNKFTEEELNNIYEVVINYNDENDDSSTFLNELKKLKNLRSITLRNGYIYNNDYNIFHSLSNLFELIFDNCEFEGFESFSLLNLKSLSLINCKIDDFSFINDFKALEELTIVNGNVGINKINSFNKLRYLQLSYSNIIDNDDINISTLEELYVDNTNIYNFEFVNNLSNLKKISIDKKQYNANIDLFESLMKKNILILNENMVEFDGDN